MYMNAYAYAYAVHFWIHIDFRCQFYVVRVSFGFRLGFAVEFEPNMVCDGEFNLFRQFD